MPSEERHLSSYGQLAAVQEVIDWIDRQLVPLPWEPVPLPEAAGRVLAFDVKSRVDVPPFERAMVDGFAVVADDTRGAGASRPTELTLAGHIEPGGPLGGKLSEGQAAAIIAGAPLPHGADAVVPLDATESSRKEVGVHRSVAPGENVGHRGEDIAAGTEVLRAGRRLRPQDIGVLSSIGVREVEVYRPVRVRVISTGNELLPPGSTPHGSKIADANGPMLEALVRRDGGMVVRGGIVPDNPAAVLAALRDDADVVVVSGGSSVGPEDHPPTLVAKHGDLAFHGVAIRPSSPSGIGRMDERLVFLLPGNSVSCLCAYDFFAGRAIRGLAGLPLELPYRKATLPLNEDIPSDPERLEYVRVRREGQGITPVAISGAALLSSTTRADGFVLVPPVRGGLAAGDTVEMYLYD